MNHLFHSIFYTVFLFSVLRGNKKTPQFWGVVNVKSSQAISTVGFFLPTLCSCNAGFVGQKCECAIGEKDESSLRAACRKDNGTECEGRGDCVCGICQCYAQQGGSTYYGTHCECENESCEKFQNKLCGGAV